MSERLKWSEEEEFLLKKEYPFKSKEELELLLPLRTWGKIKDKANKLKIKKINKASRIKNEWSLEDIEILKNNYDKSRSEIKKIFPNRTWKAIREKAKKIGLDHRKNREDFWNPEEDLFIEKNYPDSDREFIQKNINRSWSAICSRAIFLNVKRNYKEFWTDEEINFLKKNYSVLSKKEIIKGLPRHSWKAIGLKSSLLDIKRDKEAREKELIKTNTEKYGVENVSQLKETIGKINNTKNKNKSFNTSKPEDSIKNFIKNLYPNFIYQYHKDPRYFFNCDYYIPELDLFIEFQGLWVHGEEPFKENNLDPKWVIKSDKGSEYYKNAINVYTKMDPLKRKTAKENNLNYLEIWYGDYKKGFEWLYSLILKQGLPLKYNESFLKNEFNRIKTKNENYNSDPIYNKIIEHFQPHFYSKERELWNNPKIREKLIKNREKYLNKSIDETTIKQVLQGFKKSGLNPNAFSFFSPLWIKTFIKEFDIKSIYDPCAGWGHRLLGSYEIEYYGNDICDKTYKGLCNIKEYFNLDKSHIYNNPAEDFILNKKVDAIFTCPPYFKREIYEGDNTSTKKYPKYEDWLNDWWGKVIKNCLESKPKYFAFVINNKYKNDLIKVCNQYKLKFIKEIIVGKNTLNHFQRSTNNSYKGEFLVIFENI